MAFSDLEGWGDAVLAPALEAFLRSCTVLNDAAPDTVMRGAGYGGTAAEWRAPCTAAQDIDLDDQAAIETFFTMAFVPYRVSDGENIEGLFTGYYEPELRGSRTRQGVYQTPLYALPSDLVSVDLGLFREELQGQRIAGRVEGGRLLPFAPRAEIVATGLNTAEPLVYVDDPADAFFLQIQGSGRIVLDDGEVMRAAYAGQNGHPYTAIGAALIRRGEMTREEVSMQAIRNWLATHPDQAADLMNENASYVFFTLEALPDVSSGPRGSQGVALTPGASIAVDAGQHMLGAPFWVAATAPSINGEALFHRLMIAQDTGGAIRGAVRGDVFWGFGENAGEIAGRMRSSGTLAVLLPVALSERLGPRFEADAP
jgi:membrane-bound lytic murein transglycosylase A